MKQAKTAFLPGQCEKWLIVGDRACYLSLWKRCTDHLYHRKRCLLRWMKVLIFIVYFSSFSEVPMCAFLFYWYFAHFVLLLINYIWLQPSHRRVVQHYFFHRRMHWAQIAQLGYRSSSTKWLTPTWWMQGRFYYCSSITRNGECLAWTHAL